MPEQRMPERVERLDRALERVARGNPAPRMGDPDLDDLLRLANRLITELPRDLPDPAFRARLGADLARGGRVRPRAVTPAPVRFPYAVAASAIAAVLVAAIAVGSLAIWSNRDDSRQLAKQAQAITEAANTALTPTLTSATFGASHVTPTTGITVMLATIPPVATQPTATTSSVRTAVPETATSAPTAATVVTTPPPASTSTPKSALSPTAALGSVDPPQVDGTSVEIGPSPATSGGGQPPGSNLAVDVNIALPVLDDSAAVYYLATPAEDLTAVTARAAHSLGIDGEVAESQSVNGRHLELHVDNAVGHFALMPDTGAFTFATTGVAAAPDAGLTADSAAQKALDWLASVGYPVHALGRPVALAPADGIGEWRVQIADDTVPGITLGRSTGVELWIEPDGRISSGMGYWLTVQRHDTAALISAGDAVNALKAGEGYWGGGGAATAGGTFNIDSISLGYVLTNNGRGQLIAQPVVVAKGQFTTPDGQQSSMMAFVQAVRVSGR